MTIGNAPSLPTALRFVRRALDRLIQGLEPRSLSKGFYPEVPSCQIPELSFLFERVFGQTEAGTFVEVGANDGISHSNSWGLAKRSWTGLYIEPDPELAHECSINHREHPKVRVINLAAGPPGVQVADLHRAGALSTLSSEMHSVYQDVSWARNSLSNEIIEVRVETLDTILQTNHIQAGFDLLIVDTEGYEREVFTGLSLSRWRPKAIIVELADLHPDLKARHNTDSQLYLWLLSMDYIPIYKDSINTFLVDRQVYRSRIWELAEHA